LTEAHGICTLPTRAQKEPLKGLYNSRLAPNAIDGFELVGTGMWHLNELEKSTAYRSRRARTW